MFSGANTVKKRAYEGLSDMKFLAKIQERKQWVSEMAFVKRQGISEIRPFPS